MGNITPTNRGSLAKTKKQNEIIQKVNAIENMIIRQASSTEAPKFTVSENGSELVTPAPPPSSGDGGGVPDGYEETAVILVDNGAPVNGEILFKPN